MHTESGACICFVDECEFKVVVFGQRILEKNRSGMVCVRAQLCGNYARILHTISWRKLKAVTEQTNANIST